MEAAEHLLLALLGLCIVAIILFVLTHAPQPPPQHHFIAP